MSSIYYFIYVKYILPYLCQYKHWKDQISIWKIFRHRIFKQMHEGGHQCLLDIVSSFYKIDDIKLRYSTPNGRETPCNVAHFRIFRTTSTFFVELEYLFVIKSSAPLIKTTTTSVIIISKKLLVWNCICIQHTL